MAHLSTGVSIGQANAMMHVSVVSVEHENTWTFLNSTSPNYAASFNQSLTHERGGHGSFFADVTSSTYTLPTLMRCPLTPLCDRELGADHPHVPDDDDLMPCNDLGLRPLHTTALVRVPSASDSASICVTYIHLLHTTKSPRSSLTKSDQETHQDITRNYHELAVLAQTRWRLKANPALPFHLAALQVIHSALERGDALE